MNHPNVHKKGAAPAVAASVSSIIFSILASSHHWLHMGILLVLGSSTNMMSTMAGIFGLRRIMILATFVTAAYSVYRLFKHKRTPLWMKFMSSLSVVISLGFMLYTLYQFGW